MLGRSPSGRADSEHLIDATGCTTAAGPVPAFPTKLHNPRKALAYHTTIHQADSAGPSPPGIIYTIRNAQAQEAAPCKHYFHSKESVPISQDAFVHGYCTR
jgi:hypothetical protein